MGNRGHHEVMALALVIVVVVAFFALAGLFGGDSRPVDLRGRRWI